MLPQVHQKNLEHIDPPTVFQRTYRSYVASNSTGEFRYLDGLLPTIGAVGVTP